MELRWVEKEVDYKERNRLEDGGVPRGNQRAVFKDCEWVWVDKTLQYRAGFGWHDVPVEQLD